MRDFTFPPPGLNSILVLSFLLPNDPFLMFFVPPTEEEVAFRTFFLSRVPGRDLLVMGTTVDLHSLNHPHPGLLKRQQIGDNLRPERKRLTRSAFSEVRPVLLETLPKKTICDFV